MTSRNIRVGWLTGILMLPVTLPAVVIVGTVMTTAGFFIILIASLTGFLDIVVKRMPR